MKIHYLSDLHHELFRNSKKKSELSTWDLQIPYTGADIVALVGDIDVGIKGVEWAIEQSEILDTDICYVAGNHEYYSGNVQSINRKLKEVTQDTRVHVLENDFVDIKGVRILGATLWTDTNIFGDAFEASSVIRMTMNDYKKIRFKDGATYRRLAPRDTVSFHQTSLKFLSAQLKFSPLPTVVLTHHAPNILSVEQKFRTKIETAAYASDLTEFIKDHKPLAWIHGHTHTCTTYQIGETVVTTNQFGYRGIEESKEFDPCKIINVG